MLGDGKKCGCERERKKVETSSKVESTRRVVTTKRENRLYFTSLLFYSFIFLVDTVQIPTVEYVYTYT